MHNCSGGEGGIQEVKNMKVVFSTSQGYVSASFFTLPSNHIVIIITRLKVILLENKL